MVQITVKIPSNDTEQLYHDVMNDIFVGMSRLRKKIKKKLGVLISYEID